MIKPVSKAEKAQRAYNIRYWVRCRVLRNQGASRNFPFPIAYVVLAYKGLYVTEISQSRMWYLLTRGFM